uniref:Uncharacterized protein n=1 Tax=Romanomermis culicivorax TaxID=13658 RepID=A0A915L3T0_ROMCU
ILKKSKGSQLTFSRGQPGVSRVSFASQQKHHFLPTITLKHTSSTLYIQLVRTGTDRETYDHNVQKEEPPSHNMTLHSMPKYSGSRSRGSVEPIGGGSVEPIGGGGKKFLSQVFPVNKKLFSFTLSCLQLSKVKQSFGKLPTTSKVNFSVALDAVRGRRKALIADS